MDYLLELGIGVLCLAWSAYEWTVERLSGDGRSKGARLADAIQSVFQDVAKEMLNET